MDLHPGDTLLCLCRRVWDLSRCGDADFKDHQQIGVSNNGLLGTSMRRRPRERTLGSEIEMKRPRKKFCWIIAGAFLAPHVAYAVLIPLLAHSDSGHLFWSIVFAPYMYAVLFPPSVGFVFAPVLAIAVLAAAVCSGYLWGRSISIALVALQYLVVAWNTVIFLLLTIGKGFSAA